MIGHAILVALGLLLVHLLRAAWSRCGCDRRANGPAWAELPVAERSRIVARLRTDLESLRRTDADWRLVSRGVFTGVAAELELTSAALLAECRRRLP